MGLVLPTSETGIMGVTPCSAGPFVQLHSLPALKIPKVLTNSNLLGTLGLLQQNVYGHFKNIETFYLQKLYLQPHFPDLAVS